MLTTLKAKLRALFCAMIVLFAMGGGFGIWRISVVNDGATELATVWLPRAKAAETMGTLVSTYRIREARHVLSPIDGKAASDKLIAAADADVTRGVTAYRALLTPGEDATLLNDFERIWKDYKAGNAAMIEASRAGRPEEAAELFRSGRDRYDHLVAAARAIAARDGQQAATFATRSTEGYELIRLSMFGLTAIVMLAAFALAVYFEQRVALVLARMTQLMGGLARGDFQLAIAGTQRKDEIGDMARALEVFRANGLENLRLEEASKAQAQQIEAERQKNEAERLAVARAQKDVVDSLATGLSTLSEGDLTIRLDRQFPGDYEQLRVDFNGAIARLEESVRQAVGSAGVIASGTGELSSAADNLSRRTEQQAASIEETAAALEEITATVRKTSAGVAEANRAVIEATSDTERGSAIVARAIDGMSEIERSAQQINQIIGVIDEIAFQTNLLALNAGVEAARAGDAGKGFAVVASEVRALAQRSGEAAKEIKALIMASSEQVDAGVKLVGETGEALQRIAGQISGISRLMNQMATSSAEQATGIEQVNAAVSSMDQATQQNAAMVEESTAATRALADEGRGLARAMERFQLSGSGPDAGTRARAAA